MVAEIEEALSNAGLDGYVHAADIDRGIELSYRGDEPCAAASTGKVAVLVALMHSVAAGDCRQDCSRPPAGRCCLTKSPIKQVAQFRRAE
jgi:beta-lactamase class A